MKTFNMKTLFSVLLALGLASTAAYAGTAAQGTGNSGATQVASANENERPEAGQREDKSHDSSAHERDHDRATHDQDHDRSHDRDQDKDRTHDRDQDADHAHDRNHDADRDKRS